MSEEQRVVEGLPGRAGDAEGAPAGDAALHAGIAPALVSLADAHNLGTLRESEDGAGPRTGRRLRLVEHEDAAHEKRNWVRLSYDCNNHCIFCLDSQAHDGTMRATDAIKVQIIEGRRRGAERLILSGGEPTMHPNFLDFVRLGRRAGYRKVQTVTNGRMFAYPEFLARAADYGLHEITFSLHGHHAKLHDALVGTPGAFAEETAGLRAALDSGRFIVNVDIVINKMNVKHLADMLETFIGWGVKEFDLLQVIPFGGAWGSAREHLFYDLEGNLEHLQRAFAFSRRPDVHIWLNRFPAPFAEGFEELVQDPYKLHDEVRGRREEFDRLVAFGQKLDCREPERCRRCYLEKLCDGLDDVLAASRAPAVERVRVEAPLPPRTKLPPATTALVVATDLAGAEAALARLDAEEVELELEQWDALVASPDPSTVGGRPLVCCRVKDGTAARALLRLDARFAVVLELTRATADIARELAADLPTRARLVLRQPTYARVTEAREEDVDLPLFCASLPAPVPIETAPPCLAGPLARPAAPTLDRAMLDADGRVELPGYTGRFILDHYYERPLRCAGCVAAATCRGVHINWVRAHGFAALDPAAAARALGSRVVADGSLGDTPAVAVRLPTDAA